MKNHIKRYYPVLLCLIGLCTSALVSGCVQVTPTPEPVTISFAFSSQYVEHYQRLVLKFDEIYPHITVELEPISFQNQSGFTPDRADVFTDFAQASFAQWQQQGEIVALSPFIDQDAHFDLDDFYPVGHEFYRIDGGQWAIPSSVDPIVMYYNVDLFDRYGVAYPEMAWTWDDLLDKGLALRDPGGGVFGFASDPFDVVIFVHQHGGQILDDWRNPTHATFDDPLIIETLEWYDALVNEHDVAPTLDQAAVAFTPYAYKGYGFLVGKAGMIMAPFSSKGGETWGEWRWKMRWGMAPLPYDEHDTTLALCDGYAISASSPYPEAAWKWIAFLSEQIPVVGVPVVGVPARRSLAESEGFEDLVGAEVARVGRHAAQRAMALFFARSEAGEAIESFQTAVDYVVNQDMTPLEALDWIQRRTK
jgi:multiple sugar transport system substrate-binding protein